MAERPRRTILGLIRSKGHRDLRDLDQRGRLGESTTPLMLGSLVSLSILSTALTMYFAGSAGRAAAPLVLAAIASVGIGVSAGVALASAQYHANREASEAQAEVLSLLGELESERTERRAMVHDARAAVGAMGAALHALEQSQVAPDVSAAMASQVDHLREVLATRPSALTSTPLSALLPGVESFATLHGVRVDTDLPDDVHVMVDPSGVQTILLNLLDNARKYAPGSPITVSWRPVGARIDLCVADGGPGVSGNIEALFAQGTRGTAFGEGSGLGLATARRLAERSQGSLWCERPDGGGARFVLRVHRATGATPT